MRKKRPLLELLIATAVVITAPAVAEDAASRIGTNSPALLHAAPGLDADVGGNPAFADLQVGYTRFPITTASPVAQSFMDRGMAMIWDLRPREAAVQFRMAQVIDPACAMCHWGEALALGPDLNGAMSRRNIRPAWAAIGRARALADATSERERALIEALSARYGANAMALRTALDHRWAEAISVVARRWPDDPDILTLHATAVLTARAHQAHEAGNRASEQEMNWIIQQLERAIELEPAQVGALRLLVHVTED